MNSYTYGGYHIRYKFDYVNFEESEIVIYNKHFSAETSGNAKNLQLLNYTVTINVTGSFQYERFK